jgi:L-2-hydroxyglutarate oxidase LhgO
MQQVDCVVIGAGVVGLAVARQLAQAGREVIVLEAAGGIGTGISSRNSEVIHAGIYNHPDSLKSQLCVRGRRALYAYCEERQVPFLRCGKLLVATDEAQSTTLAGIAALAKANGVDNLQRLDHAAVQALEPQVTCVAALLSPDTGIIDSHAYMLALQGDAERAGAVFAFHSPLLGGTLGADGIRLEIGGIDPLRLRARGVVNCAGLQAQQVAASLQGMPAACIAPAFLAKGSYFSLNTRARFSRLVYPVPVAGGLGVHLTIDLGGGVRFGPDVEWVSTCDFAVDPARADTFYSAIRRYWPALPDGALQPDYAGIRPKISAPGAPAADFRIDGAQRHGVDGLVNLFGIESPGLTASLAIAEVVASMLR